MAVSPPEVTFIAAPWSAAVETSLMMIDGLADADIDYYREAVERREKGVRAVIVGGVEVGFMIWAMSDEPTGRVFIVEEMGANHTPGVDLVLETYRMARDIAPKFGCNRLRFFTRRKGMLAKLGDAFEVTYLLERAL